MPIVVLVGVVRLVVLVVVLMVLELMTLVVVVLVLLLDVDEALVTVVVELVCGLDGKPWNGLRRAAKILDRSPATSSGFSACRRR